MCVAEELGVVLEKTKEGGKREGFKGLGFKERVWIR